MLPYLVVLAASPPKQPQEEISFLISGNFTDENKQQLDNLGCKVDSSLGSISTARARVEIIPQIAELGFVKFLYKIPVLKHSLILLL